MTPSINRSLRPLLVASLLAVIGACDAATPSDAAGLSSKGGSKPTAQPGRDWTKVVAMTPDGGFRMGNPGARVKVIEFGSLTCSHCADFYEASHVALEQYVRAGDVSFEFRTFLLGNPIDPPISLAARCQGSGSFFRMAGDVFRQQKVWMQTLVENQAKLASLQDQPQTDVLVGILRIAGLEGFFASRGLPSTKLRQCMSNAQEIDTLGRIRREAVEQYDINSTPSFILNGERQDGVATWTQLKAKIDAALG